MAFDEARIFDIAASGRHGFDGQEISITIYNRAHLLSVIDTLIDNNYREIKLTELE